MPQHWSQIRQEYVNNEKLDKFLELITNICETHGYAISHEDTQGAFIIVPWSQGSPEWLMNAFDNTDTPGKENDSLDCSTV